MSKVIFAIVAIALLAVAGVSADLTADQQNDQALCKDYCSKEWPEEANCADVCTQSAVGEVTDCNAGENDGSNEKYAFWQGCAYGTGLNRNASCKSFCSKVRSQHKYSKFFELGCTHVCKMIVEKAKGGNLSCRNSICPKLWNIEGCWRACGYANGMVHGTDSTTLDINIAEGN